MDKTKNIPLTVSLADVEEREAEWLIPGYIPKGQINIIAGDGGAGKTTVWCDIAAAVSRGDTAFFGESLGGFAAGKPHQVLVLSAEDSLEYTLRAKLRKAGAKLENIHSVRMKDERFGKLKFDSPLLRQLVEQLRPALIVFDPLQAYIPPTVQMGQRNAMRGCLSPLIALGERYGTTSVIIVHTNKKQGAYGRNRIADSADVWDIARSVMIVGQTQDPHIRYLSQEKSNYGPLERTALFRIIDGTIHLEGYTDLRDVDYVRERDYAGYQAPQRQEAERFIVDFLRGGKQKVADLDSAATAAGISTGTLKRAKTRLRSDKQLGIENQGYGKDKVYYAYLVEQAPT